MKKYIQDFTEQEILRLREQVQKHILDGGRYEDLVKTIQQSYGVSARKAKFLARQESNLMVASFKKSRYKDHGIDQYMWRTRGKGAVPPVRPRHQMLDKEIFSWDDPPITDGKGNKNNPGEDYNCYCQAVPVVRF